MTDTEKQNSSPTRVNLWVFFLIGLLISLFGFLAEGLLFHRLWATGIFTLLGAICYAAKMRQFKPPVPFKPFLGEYLVYSAENMLYPASIGLMWIIAYFLLYWLFYGLRWVLLFPFPLMRWDMASTDFWITFVLAILLYLLFFWADVVPDPPTSSKLFPGVAGLRSEYYPVYTRQQRTFIVIIGILAVILVVPIVLFIIYGWNPAILYVWLAIYVWLVSALAITPAVSVPQTAQETVAAVGELLKASGYRHLESTPRTQDPKIDPLLLVADYFANKSRKYYVFHVIPKIADGQQVNYNDLFALKQAAWTLGEYHQIRPEDLRRQVILVDTPPDETVLQLSEDLNIDLVRLDSEKMAHVLALDVDDPARKRAASNILRAQRKRILQEIPAPEGELGEV
jgi:hypothetical protein